MTNHDQVRSPQQLVSEEIANRTNEHQPFEERLEQALADENLHRALERFAPSWRASRAAVFASEETDYGSDYSFTSMRSALRKAKDYAIEHQPGLIAQFKAQAEAAGAIVYEARTAEDANRYIYELCQSKGIDLVVKSKTMVSEETELNYYLEARGIKAVETDLGEWVAQLAHERPSHMVMPIIHKTRQQVSTLLSEATGREISREDVAEQVAVIRVEHRKAFLNSGDRKDCAKMARQTITMLEQALEESKADYIVAATTSCVVTLTQDYIRLFEDLQRQGWLQRARALSEKVMDFASFVDHVLLANGVNLPVRQRDDDVIVTYHDSCQSINCLELRSEARHIIQDVLGLELREMPQSDVCCGFGGSTSLEQGDVAERMMNNKLKNAESTGATVLVADNPGCLMHLRGGVDASGRRMRVLHLAEVIAEQLEY